MPMWMIVALLGLVIVLYASMLPRTQERKPAPDDFLDSVGDTLQQFADEIESENKELIRMVGDLKKEHEQRTSKLLDRIEQLEKQSAAAEQRQPWPVAHPAMPPITVEAYVPEPLPAREASSAAADVPYADTPRQEPKQEPMQKPVQEPVLEQETPPPFRFASTVKSRYKEVFDLYDKGKSIEFIAKKLGKNKGEVQLIIGLAKQEEPLHGQP